MSIILISFFVAFFITALIIRSKRKHLQFSADYDLDSPQKFHKTIVPRIGGIGIVLGIICALVWQSLTQQFNTFNMVLLFCAMPVFTAGLIEDLTKNVSIRTRLTIISLSSFLATIVIEAKIVRVDIVWLDTFLLYAPISIALTVFAITGLINAYNIIDGFNGLSSMIGIVTLLALAYLGYKVNDIQITYTSLIIAAAIIGFFIWNYPKGLIFLGDGGAYLIGFWVATLSVLIVARNEEISPWAPVLVNAYPITETLFSIYRRKIHQDKSPGHPDGIHLHSLIFRLILNRRPIKSENEMYIANAKTSPYLWILSSLGIIPAIFFWNSSILLIISLIIFVSIYIWFYKTIVFFRVPKWLIEI